MKTKTHCYGNNRIDNVNMEYLSSFFILRARSHYVFQRVRERDQKCGLYLRPAMKQFIHKASYIPSAAAARLVICICYKITEKNDTYTQRQRESSNSHSILNNDQTSCIFPLLFLLLLLLFDGKGESVLSICMRVFALSSLCSFFFLSFGAIAYKSCHFAVYRTCTHSEHVVVMGMYPFMSGCLSVMDRLYVGSRFLLHFALL